MKIVSDEELRVRIREGIKRLDCAQRRAARIETALVAFNVVCAALFVLFAAMAAGVIP